MPQSRASNEYDDGENDRQSSSDTTRSKVGRRKNLLSQTFDFRNPTDYEEFKSFLHYFVESSKVELATERREFIKSIEETKKQSQRRNSQLVQLSAGVGGASILITFLLDSALFFESAIYVVSFVFLIIAVASALNLVRWSLFDILRAINGN